MKSLVDILNESSDKIGDFGRDIINVLKKYEDSNITLNDFKQAYELYEKEKNSKKSNYIIEWADKYQHRITTDSGIKKFRNIDSCAKFFNSKSSEWKNTGHKYIQVFMKITSEAENKSMVIKIYWNLYNGHETLYITDGSPLNKFPSEVCEKMYDMFGDIFGHYLNQGLSEENILSVCCK